MGFTETRVRIFPDAVPLDRFVVRSRRLLRPYGFTARNSLALLGACRDELSMETALAVREHWGPPFLLMSLAGLPTYGRSALAAAASHAPEPDDGVRRLVAVLTTHIGIDRNGTVGQIRRSGQHHPTTACGALAAVRQGPSSSGPKHRVERADLEMQLLRERLWTEHSADAPPSIEHLTMKCRSTIAADFGVAARELLAGQDSLTAVFTGIVVHGHPNGDYVDPGPAVLYGPQEQVRLQM